jgi:tape measure domain-containing protein
MSIYLVTLISRIQADTSDFQKGMDQVDKSLLTLSEQARLTGTLMSQAFAGTVLFAIERTGQAVLDTAMDFDTFRRQLTAASGSMQVAAREFQSLEELARLPGQQLDNLVNQSVRLQEAGLGFAQTTRLLKDVGNAVYQVGGSASNMDAVVQVFQRVQEQGGIMGRELRTLMNQMPEFGKVMKEAFGSVDPKVLKEAHINAKEFFDTLVPYLEKIPQMSTDAATQFKNFQQTLRDFEAELGKIALPLLTQFLQKLQEYIQQTAAEVEKIKGAFEWLSQFKGPLWTQGQTPTATSADTKRIFGEQQKIVQQLQTEYDAAYAKMGDAGTKFTDAQARHFQSLASNLDHARQSMAALVQQFRDAGGGNIAQLTGAPLPKIDAPGRAAAAAAEKEREAEAKRAAEEAQRQRERDAEEAIRTNQQLTDTLNQQTLQQFDYERYQAKQAYDDAIKGFGDQVKAKQVYTNEMKRIDAEQAQWTMNLWDNALTGIGQVYSQGLQQQSTAYDATIGAQQENLIKFQNAIGSFFTRYNEEWAEVDRKNSEAHAAEVSRRIDEDIKASEAAVAQSAKDLQDYTRDEDKKADLAFRYRELGISAEQLTSAARYQILQDSAKDYLQYLQERQSYDEKYSDDWLQLQQKIDQVNQEVLNAQLKRIQQQGQAWREMIKTLQQDFQSTFRSIFDDLFQNGFQNFFSDVVGGFEKMFQQIAADYLSSQLANLVTGVLGKIAGIAGNVDMGITDSSQLIGRQTGGPVQSGHPYMVGEQGRPELFVPDQSGRVVPGAPGLGGTTVIQNISTPDANSFRRSRQQVYQDAWRAMSRTARRYA